MAHIAWFEQYHPGHAGVLGGKNTSLGVLTTAGLPVPPGFAVLADSYSKVLAENGIWDRLESVLADLDPSNSAAVSVAGRDARELILSARLPGGLADAVAEAYADLSRRCGTGDVPVAVRSSATSEDQPDASFAGEHDTYLWVRGAEAVLEHIQRCWASLFTDRAICYRRHAGYDDRSAAMSVGIQKMVLPRASGVAFTLNPLDGDRSQVAIDASWGLGEAVVSGSVTPDNYLVDKVMGDITRRTISTKHVEHRVVDGDRVVEVEVEPERRDVPCLTDDEVRAVARLARRAEKHYGCPQDVEWALDSQLPDGDNVLLLQSRPETVWSRKTRVPDPRHHDPFRSIVETLLDPNHHGRAASAG